MGLSGLDSGGAGSIVACMSPRCAILTTCVTILVLPLVACRSGGADTPAPSPPPDARRPVLKTEAELSADRAERVRKGEVVPGEAPLIETQPRPVPPPLRSEPIQPKKDSIRSDILMVNNSTLSVAEVLYPLRDWIEQTRGSQTSRGFVEQLHRRIRDHVRNEIGSLLVYEKAASGVPEQKQSFINDAVDREIDQRISHDFGDSVARFENHLQRCGLTMDQMHIMVKRQLMVSSYTREMFMPQIRIRRDELLAYYRNHADRHSTEATREFLLIAAPFDKFLPNDGTWQTASKTVRAHAKLQAMRHARAAHEALGERDFRDVAREYSRGPHAADGGSWGQIGQPLRPPYDEISRRVFEFEEGRHTEPIQTETGWYIAQCGKINPATKTPFIDVQDEIRVELGNERFGKLAGDYIYRLAERATISDLQAFINNAVEQAVADSPDQAAQN